MMSMGAFSKILVPTDFSTGSEKAWSVAQRVATSLGAELTLLHVLAATPLDVEARLAREEQRAELRSLQALHQLGIPRALEEDGERVSTVFEGPFTADTNRHFSDAGRAWAHELEAWATRARATGCKVRSVLRVGTHYREILAEAANMSADLVLLATHGRGEIQRLLVGSVADKVIRLARCPVLTVKAP